MAGVRTRSSHPHTTKTTGPKNARMPSTQYATLPRARSVALQKARRVNYPAYRPVMRGKGVLLDKTPVKLPVAGAEDPQAPRNANTRYTESMAFCLFDTVYGPAFLKLVSNDILTLLIKESTPDQCLALSSRTCVYGGTRVKVSLQEYYTNIPLPKKGGFVYSRECWHNEKASSTTNPGWRPLSEIANSTEMPTTEQLYAICNQLKTQKESNNSPSAWPKEVLHAVEPRRSVGHMLKELSGDLYSDENSSNATNDAYLWSGSILLASPLEKMRENGTTKCFIVNMSLMF